ncbi:MAG TPA: GGDEF domain-containing protein [Mobilitalea sp.]|nr:GGDEF domain-containing protein [Mobilitalea sp.]
MVNKEFEELILKYDILEKAFDNIRLVDPAKNRVLDLSGTTTEDTELKCFESLGKNKVCDNCISMRAYHDNRPYVKLEYSMKEIYAVIAIPLDLPDRRVIMEILKNATSSLIMESNQSNIYSEVQELIDKMNNLALKDSLTGIFNRRFINEKLPAEITSTKFSGKNLSIIIADIDYFKKVNDTYGHLCGDRVLKKFAKLISQCLSREEDWLARFGGEEFLICLPGADLKRTAEVAERMRKKIENSQFDCGPYQFKLTSSFGVSTVTPGMNITMEQLMEKADTKLYEAKNNGRNRVEA